MSVKNKRNTRSSPKKSKYEVLYAIGEPTYVRKERGSSEKFRALVIAHTEDPDTPTTKTGVVVKYEEG